VKGERDDETSSDAVQKMTLSGFVICFMFLEVGQCLGLV
jgi:hypothetical protein